MMTPIGWIVLFQIGVPVLTGFTYWFSGSAWSFLLLFLTILWSVKPK